ncbi:MAG: MBL fold metallo-hydrolase [Candidatus Bathyarchaeia archaeon]
MTINVRWNGGIEVDGEDTALILDPISYNPECLHALITHAHSDHSMGLYLPFRDIYSTKETMDLANIYHPTKSKGWHPINLGSKFRVGEFEVKVHNAGHILGSVLYEVAMDEGNFVYTGDLNTVKTLMMEAAEPTPCDILAIDATFGSPSFIFPSREDLSTEIVRWAISSLRKNMIPTFQTDSMGNAQEIISILNKATNIPIVTHPRISAVNTVYGAYGYSLNYLDARSEEADELLSECSCALILPKGASAPKKAKPNIALASGWALYIKDDRKPLPLSDHADFINLIKFISEAHPDIVLTFHGGKRNVVLADYVERKL